jgi:hypothetical protein
MILDLAALLEDDHMILRERAVTIFYADTMA